MCGVAQAGNIFDEAVTSCNGDYAIWQSTDGRYVDGDIKCENKDLRCYFPSVITIKVKKANDGSFYGYTNENGMNAANSYLNFTATANGNTINVFADGAEQRYSIDSHAFIISSNKEYYGIETLDQDGKPIWTSRIDESGFNFMGCSKF